MLHTRFSDLYGLKAPFISAGMAFVATPPLVAAVSNAGGMGTLGASLLPPKVLSAQLQQIRSLTSRPFGVNFITQFATEAHIDACLEAQVPVVSFFWNDPPVAFIARLHHGGAKVWMQVGSVQEAKAAQQAGVDALIVQGSEAGGHNRSTASTFVLVPAVADAVAPVPVIAAGGIADGRGMVAALALGAEAVWVGTRLVASTEANAHPEYQRRIVAALPGDTLRTRLFGPEWPHQPARVLRNRVVSEWEGREDQVIYTAEPAQGIGHTVLMGQEVPLPKFSALLPTPETTGDFEEMCLVAGESAGLVQAITPAGQIVEEMMREARQIIDQRLTAGGKTR